jgi:hypothetical protein
VFGSLNKKER